MDLNQSNAFTSALNHHHNGRFAEAILAYEASLQDDSDDPDVRNNLGVALCQHSRVAEGVVQFRLALSQEKTDLGLRAEVLGNLGLALLSQEDCLGAVDALSGSMAINPSDGEVRLALGRAYKGLSDLEQATQQFEAAVSLLRENDEAVAELRSLTPAEDPSFNRPSLPESQTERLPRGNDVLHQEKVSPQKAAPISGADTAGPTPTGALPSAQMRPLAPAHIHIAKRPFRPRTVEKLQVIAEMDRLSSVFNKHDFSELQGKIKQKKEDISGDSVLVFVIGEGNFGKSSLINHILGRIEPPVAPVSFKALTWRIDLFHPLPNGSTEYAKIRRAGRPGLETLAIKDAEKACLDQEKEVRERAKASQTAKTDESSPTLAFEGQIIEVHWHYTGLGIPENVVLVDTPGFAQVRPGLTAATAETMASAEGVVFDIGEIYDRYYYRANCVLWAFKATKVNDEDTNRVFERLSRQNKEIVGIATCVDSVPEGQRGELMDRLSDLYGSRVSTFIQVVAGGKSDLVGLGIRECRQYIGGVAAKAETLQLDEARRFMSYEAAVASSWLVKIGETLVSNVSEISLYCNATAGELLAELRRTRDTLGQKMDGFVFRQADTGVLRPRIRNLLLDEIPKRDGAKAASEDAELRAELSRHYQETLRSFLRLPEMEVEIASHFQRADAFVVSAGKQQWAGRGLKGVVLKEGGEAEPRPLHSHIKPPDLARYRMDLPELNLPLVSPGAFQEMLLAAGLIGGLIGGLGLLGSLAGCGCAPIVLPLLVLMAPALYNAYQEEKAKENRAIDGAVAEAQNAVGTLPRIVQAMIGEHAKGVAASIIDSADATIGEIYPSQDLSSLARYAGQIDADLRELAGFGAATGLPMAPRPLQFQTLYQVWSPRDDPRAAAIEVFCDWFEERQAGYQTDAAGWLSEACHEQPLEHSPTRLFCRDYLKATRQRLGMMTMQALRDMNTPQGTAEERLVRPWLARLQSPLRAHRLFTEEANSLLDQFENISLSGIAASLTDAAVGRFEAEARDLMSDPAASIFVPGDAVGFKQSRRAFTRWPVLISVLLSLPMAAAAVTLAARQLHDVHGHWHLHVHGYWVAADEALIGLCAFLITMGILVAAGLAAHSVHWGSGERRRVLGAMEDRLYAALDPVPGEAWKKIVAALDRQFARTVVGQKTLVKPRMLDYALEGILDVPESGTAPEGIRRERLGKAQ